MMLRIFYSMFFIFISQGSFAHKNNQYIYDQITSYQNISENVNESDSYFPCEKIYIFN